MRPERTRSKPEVQADRRAEVAVSAAARDRAEAQRLARDLADMREDRDRWRAQAERLTAALERLRVPAAPPPATSTPAGPSLRAAETEADDILHGVPRIAAALKLTPQQVYHLKDRHGLPTFKVGRIVCARRGAIAAWIAAKGDAAAVAPQEGR